MIVFGHQLYFPACIWTLRSQKLSTRYVPAVFCACISLCMQYFIPQLLFDIPGVEKKDITLSQNGDYITVSAERRAASSTTSPISEGVELKRVERFSGHVSRTLRIPEGVDHDRIHADYHNGVLHVRIPKLHLDKKPDSTKEIPIKG